MKTRSLTLKELNDILTLFKSGFTYRRNNISKTFRPKLKIYFLLLFQLNTELRIGYVLILKKKNIIN